MKIITTTVILIVLKLSIAWAGSDVITWGADNEGKLKIAVYSLPDLINVSQGTRLSPISQSSGFAVGGDYVVSYGEMPTELNVPVGLTNVTAIATGHNRVVALKEDGTLVGWGNKIFEETNHLKWFTNVCAITVGAEGGLALQTNGTTVAWGLEGGAGRISNIVAISACPEFFCQNRMALKQDGTVLEWRSHSSAVTPRIGITNAVAIAAGAVHNLVLKQDGTVEAWGSNAYGEIIAPAGLSNVMAIAASGSCSGAGTGCGFSLALKKDGTLVAWGQMGVLPATVPAGLSNIVAIAAGPDYCLAITTNRAVADKFRN